MKQLTGPDLSGLKVLELGCASGVFSKEMTSMGARVTGVDLSEKLLSIARSENPDSRFILADASSLPLKRSAFDLVAASLLMHYFKDLRPFFSEAARVLKKNGAFVFSFHHPVHEIMELKNGKKFVPGNYFDHREYSWKMLGRTIPSFHHTFEEITTGLNDCGFVLEKLLEPQPDQLGEKINPKAFEMTSEFPVFAAIRARLSG
ncbi:MAG: class I SAM-dependent methyltransferase [Candidatus Wallbacteria bacterium]|nr:class I SAM-dependent methyltransferase [Candidatus Wallbacteria bacterium]